MANQPILSKYSVATTEPTATYYFQTSYGVYPAAIATVTGVTSPTDGTQDLFDSEPVTSVKELIRTGILTRKYVRVKDETSGNEWIKTLLVSADKLSTFDNNIVPESPINWAVGKGAGLPIVEVLARTRVASRQ